MKERVKTMLDWDTFGESAEKGGFDYFAKPGDLVDEEIYNHFLNVLPPHLMGKRGYLQAGEMHSIAYNPYEKREEGRCSNIASRAKRALPAILTQPNILRRNTAAT